jgi:MATE family multidrug resistance protein
LIFLYNSEQSKASNYICHQKNSKVNFLNILKSFLIILAYPIILGMLGHTIVGIVDNIMVGQIGPTELAAVSLGNSFIFIALSLGIGFLRP